MDQLGYEQGSAHPLEMVVDLAYSQMLSEKFSASVAMRFIYFDLNANGFNGAGGEGNVSLVFRWRPMAGYYRQPIALSTGDALLSFGLNILI